MSSVFAAAERDALGIDVRTTRHIHADVLNACERAAARGLATQGTSADAPAPSDKVTTTRLIPAPGLDAARLRVARAAVADISPTQTAAAAAAEAKACEDAAALWFQSRTRHQ